MTDIPASHVQTQARCVQVQSIIYHLDHDAIARAATSLARAADLALQSGVCADIILALGDTSSRPCLSDSELSALQQRFPMLRISYRFFDSNLGSARGHNELAAGATADYLLILNPDVVVSPRLFEHMMAPFADSRVGMVEAKQIPLEHPKYYDPVTGETSWAATACALLDNSLFRKIEGFDSKSFFLYCDDVDYSWRVREAGYKVIFAPSAVVFHDKRLSDAGRWQPTSAERYYSAEAALLMAHKWSYHAHLARLLASFKDGAPDERKAYQSFQDRLTSGRAPSPRDPDHKTGTFDGINYTRHRYAL